MIPGVGGSPFSLFSDLVSVQVSLLLTLESFHSFFPLMAHCHPVGLCPAGHFLEKMLECFPGACVSYPGGTVFFLEHLILGRVVLLLICLFSAGGWPVAC